MQAILRSNPIASVVSNPRLPDNPIVGLNESFVELTGYAAEDVLDRTCRFLSGNGTEPWLSEKIRQSVAEHRPILVEILNYKKDGSTFRNAVLVAPIYANDDDLVYFLRSHVEIVTGLESISENCKERAIACLGQLSPRQLEVVKLVAKGLLNKQIAAVLNLSEKTVKMHRGLAMDKLELNTQAKLVRIVVQAGF